MTETKAAPRTVTDEELIKASMEILAKYDIESFVLFKMLMSRMKEKGE